jgi:hypothetical protein
MSAHRSGEVSTRDLGPVARNLGPVLGPAPRPSPAADVVAASAEPMPPPAPYRLPELVTSPGWVSEPTALQPATAPKCPICGGPGSVSVSHVCAACRWELPLSPVRAGQVPPDAVPLDPAAAYAAAAAHHAARQPLTRPTAVRPQIPTAVQPSIPAALPTRPPEPLVGRHRRDDPPTRRGDPEPEPARPRARGIAKVLPWNWRKKSPH